MFGEEPKTSLDELIKLNAKENFDIKKWKDEKIPAMLERIKIAQLKRKEMQKKNIDRKNKQTENKIYKTGDLVWVRQEPTTDVDKEEHKKLKLPWSGPFEICEPQIEKYGNSYKVRRTNNGIEETKVVNISNLKEYIPRPAWMCSDDDFDPDAKKEIVEEMDVETPEKDDLQDKNYVPGNKKDTQKVVKKGKKTPQLRSEKVTETTTEKYIPSLEDPFIDVEFNTAKGKRWACGKVTKVDKNNHNRVFIEFEDSHKYSKFDRNDDWFNLATERDLKFRRCEEKNGHKRSDEMSVLNIQKHQNNYRKTKQKKIKMQKKKKQENIQCMKGATEGRLGSHVTHHGIEEVSMDDMESKTSDRRLTVNVATSECCTSSTARAKEMNKEIRKEGTMKVPVQGKQIEITGGAEFLVEFLGKMMHLEVSRKKSS
jgi:hypothetical protein